MWKNILTLVVVISTGIVYYRFSVSKKKELRNYAFFIKLAFLFLSFILAFLETDYISFGSLAYGGRSSIIIIILIEIIDAFVDRKNNKQNYKKDKS